MLTDAKVAAVKAPSSGQKEYPDNKVTGLRLRVGSGGTKTWIYRARAGSRTINKKLGTYPGMKLADAREAALKAVEAIARSGSAEVLERTFGALAEHWIKYVAKPKNDSWKNQERTLERHVLPRWRDRKVADIRRAEVRDLVEGLEGVVLPNRVLALVKTILRYALSRDWIDFSPAEGIRKPRSERSRDRVLAMDEVAAIWKAAEHLGYALTQTDYNADDSVNCVATRMNTAVYGSLPSSACTLSTQGSFGPDHITKNNYDPAGQLTSIQVAYGTADQATERTLAYTINGKIASLNYDRLVTGELSKVREDGASSGAGVLATYAYNNLGERTSLTAGNGTVTSWSYDPTGRLASLTQDLAGTANDLTITNSHNPASQIISRTSSNSAYAWTGSVDVTRGYTSNGLNQYSAAGPASFTYDANGNLTSDGTSTFTYDTDDKLTSTSGSTNTSLSYDPLERLDTYNPGSAERFIYDGNEAVAELDSSGNIIGRFVRGDGADELLVSYPDSGTSNRRWVHLDERNSVIALTDGSGNVTATNRYDEYGVPQSTNSGLFQYTGQMWLSQAGLQYSKARIYSPTVGRFLQTDPIGQADSSNLYQYALNDPVNGSDPSGNLVIGCTGSLNPVASCSDVPGLTCSGNCGSFLDLTYIASIVAGVVAQNNADLSSAQQANATNAIVNAVAGTGSYGAAAWTIDTDASLASMSSIGSGGLNGKGYVPQTTDYFLLGATILGEADGHPDVYAAVGWAIVNRVGDPRYPNTLAGVVFQPSQFDAINHPLFQNAYYYGGLGLSYGNSQALLQTNSIAIGILSGQIPDRTGGAMQFFSGPPIKAWERQMQPTLQRDGYTFGP